MNLPLDLPLETSNSQNNLPQDPQELNQNPNPESLKPNRSPSQSQQPVTTVQEEEGMLDVVEVRLQLKKERND